MPEALIIDACRTPRGIGKVGKGALADFHPQHLGAAVLKALAERNNLNTAEVDDIIWGTSSQRGKQGGDLGRMAALDAGYDTKASGMTLDRFCGSGITTVNLAAAQIMSGMEDLVIAGGTEMMSYTSSTGDPSTPPMMDSGNLRLRARHPQTQQGVCADAIATLSGFSRTDVDAFAAESQKRAAAAWAADRFKNSIVPVKHCGVTVLAHDEFMRPETTVESLSALKASFAGLGAAGFDSIMRQRYPEIEAVNHVHHAGNSSGIVDGASGLLIGTKEMGEKMGLKPRARIVGTASIGSEPTIMLTGPVAVTQKALARAGMSIDDIDLFELNEAFASVVMYFMQQLNVSHDKMNVNGGAIAMGHPLGATGGMILGTLLDELERTGKSTGLATLCVGAGMGTATIIERV